MAEDKVFKSNSSEFAEAEFDRFAEKMDLQLDPAAMNDEDKRSLADARGKVVRAIMLGSLVVDTDGQPVFTPQRSDGADALTFHEPTGASLMAMDRKKKGADITKTYAVLADITRTDVSVFSKMLMADLNVCLAVLGLFLG